VDFEIGRVYGLIGELIFGAPAISWCVAGRLSPDSGVVLVDREEVSSRFLRELCFTVWVEPEEQKSSKHTVRDHIEKGLGDSGIAYSLEDLVDTFALQRLNRPLHQHSAERWRASATIGFAQGKSVFCFPWMWHDFVARYRDLWIGPLFDFLRVNGCLVLAPTSNVDIRTVCDEVIHIP
jgi:hypothetical protein